MKKIQSVCGEISPSDFGVTLAHEHVFYGWAGWEGCRSIFDYEAGYDEKAFYKQIEEQQSLLPEGIRIRTIIDPTPNDCGRDVTLLKRFSENLEINVVCGTGYYSEDAGGSVYFKRRKSYGCDIRSELQRLMETELYEGIEDTGVKAAFVKIGCSPQGITAYEEELFQAACNIANADSDVRIYVHQSADNLAQTTKFFKERGVEPRQIMLCHACNSKDLDLQKKLMDEGYFLGFDRFGLGDYPGTTSNDERIENLSQLIKDGYEDRIIISTDHLWCNLGMRENYDFESWNPVLGSQTWDFLFNYAVKGLHEKGVSKEQTAKLVEDNPIRFFSEI